MEQKKPWYMNAIFYQIYPRSFYDANGDGYGDFQGITEKLDYIKSLGIDCIWIMPIYPSPLVDDGYDISDFSGVSEKMGTLSDYQNLIEGVHQHGMRIIMDLVLNHCSDQHPWFQEARKDRNSKYRNYFVWSDTDQKYSGTRIIFCDTQKSNWTWDNVAGQYFWHRFYPQQPDLNYDNPELRNEMKNIMRYWMRMGIDGFRADAVPYLFEREGTSNENLPETHAFLKELRKMLDDEFPGSIMLCESNMWAKDVRPYFGDGDEFQLGFHFPLMPRIFKSIGMQDARSIIDILNDTPSIPENCQWCTFLRNHDELTLEMVTEEDRQWMWDFYAPETNWRINLGIRRRLWPLLGNDIRKVTLAWSLLFTLPGSPVLYYGDEIGMGDDVTLYDRNCVRTLMQWNNSPNGGCSVALKTNMPAIHDSVYGYQTINIAAEEKDLYSPLHRLRRMVRIRKESEALSYGKLTWITNTKKVPVLAYVRDSGTDQVWIIQNLTDETKSISLDLPQGSFGDILSSTRQIPGGMGTEISVEPYQCIWLRKIK